MSVGSRSTCSLRSIAFRMAGEGFDRAAAAPEQAPGSAGGDSCALAVTRRRSSHESSRGSTPDSRMSLPVGAPSRSTDSKGSRGSRGSQGSRGSCVPPGLESLPTRIDKKRYVCNLDWTQLGMNKVKRVGWKSVRVRDRSINSSVNRKGFTRDFHYGY